MPSRFAGDSCAESRQKPLSRKSWASSRAPLPPLLNPFGCPALNNPSGATTSQRNGLVLESTQESRSPFRAGRREHNLGAEDGGKAPPEEPTAGGGKARQTPTPAFRVFAPCPAPDRPPSQPPRAPDHGRRRGETGPV
uniref:Uncharacterized protein n=1 Tax=Bursaphelenchus xylophilus TaxID=6326 RepID=A0A1I7RZ16_BURXY